MAIARELLFANGKAYKITATMTNCIELHRESPVLFPRHDLSSVVSVLMDMKYLIEVDYDVMLPAPYTGTLTCLDIWLNTWGVEDTTMQDLDESTIGTYSVTDNDFTLSDDECIEDDEEDDMVYGLRILQDNMSETQEIDELAQYGHTSGDPDVDMDSFCDV